jgi:hypothetical protein
MKAILVVGLLALCGCTEHTASKLVIAAPHPEPKETAVASRGRALRCASPHPARPVVHRRPRA